MTIKPAAYDFENWIHGSDVAEWGTHKPRNRWFLEWRWFAGWLNGADGVKYFLYVSFESYGKGFYQFINKEVKRQFSEKKALTSVCYRLVNTESGETVFYQQAYTDTPLDKIYEISTNTWKYQDARFSETLSYTGQGMTFTASSASGSVELTAANPFLITTDSTLSDNSYH